MNTYTIAIVGLGLIGGSMAMALHQQTPHTVLGLDSDPHTLMAALKKNAVHRAGGTELLTDANVVVLALPPEATITFVKEHRHDMRAGTIVTDVCGVKRTIVEACASLCQESGLHFVGGHPMAGKEKGGFAHADASLFIGASYILTPSAGTPDTVVEVIREMATSLGCAKLTVTSPENHDRMIAFTSQLPHVLAGAYVKSPCCPDHDGFSAGSYRDVSRVAAVDEAMWSQLFLMNADNLCGEIDTLIANLQTYRDTVTSGNAEQVQTVIREGREIKEHVQI